jgi:hypothetical protein
MIIGFASFSEAGTSDGGSDVWLSDSTVSDQEKISGLREQ